MKRFFVLSIGLLMTVLLSGMGLDSLEFGYGESVIATTAALGYVSANVTSDMIRDMKLKYGFVKIITVIAEAAVYDIDELAPNVLANLKKHGFDIDLLRDKSKAVELRMFALEKNFDLACTVIGDTPGKILCPAETYQFIARRPDRSTMKMLTAYAREGNDEKFADVALQNIIVGGDIDKLDDGVVYAGVLSEIKGLMKPAASFLQTA